MKIHEHEEIGLLFDNGDEFFEVKDFRKDLLFASGKLPIEIIPHNTSAIVTYKNAVRIEHRKDVKAETKVLKEKDVLWVCG